MMLALCLLMVILAVWWAIPHPAGLTLSRRLVVVSTESAVTSRSRPRPRVVVIMVVTLGPIIGAVLIDGARGGLLSAAGAMILITAGRLLVQHRRRRTVIINQIAVSRACNALAAQLRIGQVPAEALITAAVDHPVLADAERVLAIGGDVARVWRAQARRDDGHAGLGEVARAWQVSLETGAPMAATLEQVAAGLAADHRLQAVIAGELAAPRATSKVMAMLPFCGIGLGYVLGGDPIGWLLAGPLGWGCLFLGALLACAGVLWIEALARQAT